VSNFSLIRSNWLNERFCYKTLETFEIDFKISSKTLKNEWEMNKLVWDNFAKKGHRNLFNIVVKKVHVTINLKKKGKFHKHFDIVILWLLTFRDNWIATFLYYYINVMLYHSHNLKDEELGVNKSPCLELALISSSRCWQVAIVTGGRYSEVVLSSGLTVTIN